MHNEILFTETQKFRQWWLWLLLVTVNAVSIFSLSRYMLDKEPFAEKPDGIALLILTGIIFLFTILFVNCRLDTKINKDGVYVRFFPFHLNYQYYGWVNITKSYVRKYSPLFEYGGWGLRFSIFGKGTAFNISGDDGLQLEFLSQKKLLIGTRKPDELRETLNRLGQLKE
jgi:hypothetical protein